MIRTARGVPIADIPFQIHSAITTSSGFLSVAVYVYAPSANTVALKVYPKIALSNAGLTTMKT